MKVQFSQRICGGERKELLAPIAEINGQNVHYAGAPTFAYEAAGWSIDKNNLASSPVFSYDNIELHTSQLELLKAAG